jgi:hypothetical protein
MFGFSEFSLRFSEELVGLRGCKPEGTLLSGGELASRVVRAGSTVFDESTESEPASGLIETRIGFSLKESYK